MKMHRSAALLLAALMSLLCLSGAFAETADDPLMATVNGTPIRLSQVTALYENIISYYTNEGYDMTLEDNMAVARRWALSSAVQDVLVTSYAADKGLDVISAEDEAQLVTDNDTMWETAIASYIEQQANLPENATEDEKNAARLNAIAYFESAGYTRESTLASSRASLVQERVMADVASDVTVTDAEIQAQYFTYAEEDKSNFESNVGMYEFYTGYYGYSPSYMPEGYRGVLHILLKVDDTLMTNYTTLSAKYEEQAEAAETSTATDVPAADTVTLEQVDAAKKAIVESVQPTIDEIMTKYNSGTAFLDLVDEYGADPGMKDETNRTNGYAVHMDSIMWDPAFTAGAFSVSEIGQVSEPVVGTNGVHLIYYLRDIPGGILPMSDEMRATIYENLMSSKETEAFSAVLNGWMADADIVYTDAAADYLPEEEEAAPAE